jgi:hypothetical protein
MADLSLHRYETSRPPKATTANAYFALWTGFKDLGVLLLPMADQKVIQHPDIRPG